MALTGLTGLFETVVAAANEATQVLKPTHAAQRAIYWDHSPEESAALYQTINVPLPADPTSQVSDIGSGDLQVSDQTVTTVPIILDQHPSFSFPVRDYDQFRTPTKLRSLFMDGAITGIQNYINAKVAALFNSTNFTTNTAVSATGGAVTVTQFTGAMAVLSDQRVQTTDNVRNMHVLLPSVPYTKILDPTTGGAGAAWSQAFIAGNKYAEEIRETGIVPVAFGTQFHLDQQMPTTGVASSRTFTGAYFHRWAVSGVSRPLATDDIARKTCEVMYKDFGNITLRIMVSYSHYPKLAPIVSVDAGFGLKVTRENMGVLFSIAE